jgi:transketolase
MVRTHLCYGEANVKLMAAYAGLSDSFDGPTHHAITDVAIMRSLPNMTIVIPSDGVAIDKLLPQVVDWQGPVYFRLNRNDVPVIFSDSYAPVIGKAYQVLPGDDLTIFANGYMLARSLEAAQQLAGQGIAARVVEMHTVKPLDVDAVVRAAEETGAVVTAEEGSIVGGLGGAVAEVLSEQRPVPLKRVGVADRFTETGPYTALLDRYGMAVADIVAASRQVLSMKTGAKKVFA